MIDQTKRKDGYPRLGAQIEYADSVGFLQCHIGAIAGNGDVFGLKVQRGKRLSIGRAGQPIGELYALAPQRGSLCIET